MFKAAQVFEAEGFTRRLVFVLRVKNKNKLDFGVPFPPHFKNKKIKKKFSKKISVIE